MPPSADWTWQRPATGAWYTLLRPMVFPQVKLFEQFGLCETEFNQVGSGERKGGGGQAEGGRRLVGYPASTAAATAAAAAAVRLIGSGLARSVTDRRLPPNDG
jgi:hypothetical protein